MQSGRDTIKMLKDIFNIGTVGMRKVTLVAEIGRATVLHIESMANLNEVDITASEISKNDLIDEHVYEVSIKRVNNEIK